MLTNFQRRVGRALLGLGLVGLALAGTGCGAIESGTHDTNFDFLVAPLPAGSFHGWTNITLGIDVSSVGAAELYGVTLQVEKPTGIADLSFMTDLVASTGGKELAHISRFERGETSAEMAIDFTDDLHALFSDGKSIHIDWNGTANPEYTAWPADGIWVSGDVTINLD